MLYLETARLILTPFTRADLDFLHALWTEPGVRRYLWDDQILSRDQVGEVIESSLVAFAQAGYGCWKLSLKETALAVGFCGLRQFSDAQVEEGSVEILYGLTAAHWGKGLAVEAARVVLGFGFKTALLEQIYAGADPPNAASFRVMEKLGMQFNHRTELNGVAATYYVITREVFSREGAQG